MMDAAALRRSILEADDRPRQPVDTPWTDEKLYVRAMSIGDWDRFAFEGQVDMSARVMAQIVCRNLTTEDGTPIFTDEDVDALLDKNAQPVVELCQTIMRLSGLMNEEDEATFVGAQPGKPSTG